MSMLNALAMLGSGAKGFVQGGRDEEAAQRARDAEAFAQQQRSFQSNQMQRTLQQQAAVDAAGQPVQATPDMIQGTDGQQVQNTEPDPSTDSIDVGQPGTAPAIPTSTVAGKSGLNPMQTQAALAAANSPDAIVQRQVAALSQTDPAAAMKMQAESLQSKAATIDIATKTWNNDLSKARAGGLDGLVKFMSDSAGDGQGGQFKAKAVVSDDGKTFQIMALQPDGSVQPTKMPPLPNDADGWDKLAYGLANVPIEQRVAHAFAEKSQLEKSRHDMAMETQGAERNRVMEEWYAPRGQAALQNADTAAAKLNGAGGGNTLARLSPDDKAEYDDLHKKSAALDASLTKGRMDAAAMGQQFDPKNPTLAPLFEQQAILNRKLQQLVGKYRTAAPAQDPTGPTTTTRPATPMETVLQDMKKTGTTQANVQLAGQPQMQIGAGPASTATPPAPAGVAPVAPAAPAAPPVSPMQTFTGDKTLQGIEAANVASMAPLNDAVQAARTAMAAAAKSGDSAKAIQAAQKLGDATRARAQAAQQKFGNRAQQYLASIGA